MVRFCYRKRDAAKGLAMKSDWIYPLMIGLLLGASLMLLATGQRERAGIYVPCAVAIAASGVPAGVVAECKRKGVRS